MSDPRRAAAFASFDREDPWNQSRASTMDAAVIAESAWPRSYQDAWAALDRGGEIATSQLEKAFEAGGISSASSSKILSLTTARQRVDRSEFSVAMALAALAQQGKGA